MTYREIDRMFFEHIRRKVVALGLLPEITNYNTKQDWDNAKEALRASLGFSPVEIFGDGSSDARKQQLDNRITVNRTTQNQGSIGVGPFPYMEKQADDTFVQKRHLDHSRDLLYIIRCIGKNTHTERLMMEIVDSVLGQRRYMETIDDNGNNTGEGVLVEWASVGDVPTVAELREVVYVYQVSDVWIGEEIVLKTGVPPLNTVDFGIQLFNSI